jgi:hypothetical protein
MLQDEVSILMVRSAATLSQRTRHCEERSDEAIHSSFTRQDGLLRGVYHRAALSADPLARNDDFNHSE